MAILPADTDILNRFAHRSDQGCWWCQRNLNPRKARGSTVNRTGLGKHCTSPVHLPIANNIGDIIHPKYS
jgi:hypothetical protein